MIADGIAYSLEEVAMRYRGVQANLKASDIRIKGKMICPLCKGNMKKTVVNFPVDLKTYFILIKGVPARVCKQCGEFYINDKIHMQIERIVKRVEETNSELKSVKFVT